MSWSIQLLLANTAATFFMMGLIWMVQVVHYPLFDDVGETSYVQYQKRHQTNISLIVGPVMLIELATAILLAVYPLEGIGRPLVYTGIGLIGLIWLSTAFIQVPCHERLVQGFDRETYRWLVNSNWIRTIAWSARGVVVAWMLVKVLPSH